MLESYSISPSDPRKNSEIPGFYAISPTVPRLLKSEENLRVILEFSQLVMLLSHQAI